MKTLFCFYDMAVSPCSFDFFTFLYSAEACRIRRGLDDIKLIFIHGPNKRFRQDTIRTAEQNETFFNNVIITGISLLPSVLSFMWLNRREATVKSLPSELCFPRDYSIMRPTAEYVGHELVAAQIRGDKPGFLQAPTYAKNLAADLIKNRLGDRSFVTLTVRELARDNSNGGRNIDKQVWQNAFDQLKVKGITPIVIRDTQNAFDPAIFAEVLECPEASVHLPIRMALYEQALINFTKNNGPGCLQLYSKARSIYFNNLDPNTAALSPEWNKNNYGICGSGQFPLTTQTADMVWKPESLELILQATDMAQTQTDENQTLNKISTRENLAACFVISLQLLMRHLSVSVLEEDVHLFTALKCINQKHQFMSCITDPIETLVGNKIATTTYSDLIERASAA